MRFKQAHRLHSVGDALSFLTPTFPPPPPSFFACFSPDSPLTLKRGFLSRGQHSRFLAGSSGRCFSLGPPPSSSEPIRTGLRVAWLPPGPPTVGAQLMLRGISGGLPVSMPDNKFLRSAVLVSCRAAGLGP